MEEITTVIKPAAGPETPSRELLNNPTNDKLYILYRNPQKRYYSGIIEDLIRVIDSINKN